MTKGTPSFGKHNKVKHIRCRRCGRPSYNKKTKVCAACHYGASSKIRNYKWQTHTVRRIRKK
jgi:large subunit ribosomal protein L37e